jgi:hypothetical protein
MLLNTLIFFIITQISFYSIVGYGTLLKNNLLKNIWLENFINFTIGIIIINLIGQFLYYLNLNSYYLNFLILLVGLSFFNFKKNKDIIYKQILINIIFFSGLLISKLHEDWPYHFNFIEQISSHSPIIGIGNVDDIHILSTSFFSYVQKIFFLPFFQFKLIFIPVYLVFLNLMIFLIQIILENKNKLSLIVLMILTIIIVKMSRISEFGYDYLSNFILLKIVVLFLINQYDFEKNYIFKNIYILFFLYAVTIKITALFFAPILIYFLYTDFNKKKIILNEKYNFLLLLLCFLFLIENFLKSGCFLYFIESTCLNKDLISWSIDYYRVTQHSEHVELWAKGFYIQDLINNPTSYLNIKNWFTVWTYNHFFYKIFEFILVPILFLSYILITENFIIKNKKYIWFLLISTISLLSWFIFLPQLRFGSTILIVFFVSIVLIFLNKNMIKKFDNKNYATVIIFLILVFNFKNINRISNEFLREDVHKFTYFPFPPEKRILPYIKSTNTIKFLLHNGRTTDKYRWFTLIN